jgi:hypothetical protein
LQAFLKRLQGAKPTPILSKKSREEEMEKQERYLRQLRTAPKRAP